MRKKRPYKLGDVQLELMKIVWEKGKATVREVTETISAKRTMAYSTVLTMLRDLERKGVLVHDVDGRAYVYRPAISRKRITTGIIGDIKRRLFDNSAAALLAHLLEAETIAPGELERMRRMITEKEQGTGRSTK